MVGGGFQAHDECTMSRSRPRRRGELQWLCAGRGPSQAVLMARPHLLLAILLGGLAAACGGDSSSTGDGGQGGGGGGQTPPPSNQITIRGGERIVWDQKASSVQVARSYTYRLFIDSSLASFSDLRCNDTGSSAGYECSGLLPSIAPGQHTLEVAAVSGILQSALSVPIVVRVVVAATTGMAPESSASDAGASLVGPACVSTQSAPCYDAQLVAGGLSSVTGLIFTPDDRAFFIHGGQEIREIRNGELIASPLLSRESASARLISLAVARDFAETRVAFVAWSEPTADGREVLNVTRYREVAGSFGEGATILANLPIPTNSNAPLATDEQGYVYLALPASERATQSGAILRVDSSGAVPSTNPMYSPVVSSGYAVPSGLVWDGVSRQLWAAGTDVHWSQPLLALPVARSGQIGSLVGSGLPLPQVNNPDRFVPAFAISPKRSGSEEQFWLIAAPGRVFRGDLNSKSLSLRSFGSLGMPRDIVEGSSGQLLLVTDAQDGSTNTAIWHMTSRSGVAASLPENISPH